MSELSPDQLRAIVFGQGGDPAPLGSRRDEERYWADGSVTFTVLTAGHAKNGEEHQGLMVDTSIHGLRFRTALPLEIGLSVRVEFSPNEGDSPITTDATVTRVDRTPAGFEVGVVYQE